MKTTLLLALVLTLPVWVSAQTQPPPAAPAPPAPSWERLKAAYDYDNAKVPTVTEAPKEDANYTLAHWTFTNAKGQKVPGLFLKPKGNGKFPLVLLLHGLTSNKETMINLFGRQLAARGIASLALDADLHGERKAEGKIPAAPVNFVGVMRGAIVDYRQVLDYLATRPDVDNTRIGLCGYSMGAMMGSITMGVEPRVTCALLCVGGDPIADLSALVPPALREQAAFIAPANYVGYATPRPVFFINGTKDATIRPSHAEKLHAAAKAPKIISWVEQGHILTQPQVKPGLDWLVSHLTP